jgi:DNA-binding transcriptional LysR family regulator
MTGTRYCLSSASFRRTSCSCNAILAALDVGTVPDYVLQEDILRGDVVTALDQWRLSIVGTHMYMLYMPNRYPTRATLTFIEFVLDKAHSAGGG